MNELELLDEDPVLKKRFDAVVLSADSLSTQREEAIGTRFEDVEAMYFMDWEHAAAGRHKSVSPTPRNKLKGMVRLLTSTEPEWNLPRKDNETDVNAMNEKLERASNAMWRRSDRVQSTRVQTEMAHSGGLYDEIHVRIISTKDLLEQKVQAAAKAKEYAEVEGSEDLYDEAFWEGEVAEAKMIAKRVPMIYEPLSAAVCTPVWERTGLVAHYTESRVAVDEVKKMYANASVILAGVDDFSYVTLVEWWDRTYRFVWVKEYSSSMVHGSRHGLGFIPVVSVIVEGKAIHRGTTRRNEPFLYTLLQSGMWPFQNGILTAMRKNVMSMINAEFIHTKKTPTDRLEVIQHDVIGNVVSLMGTLQPMGKDLIPADAMVLWNLVDQTVEASTMYAQAFGEKLQGNNPYALNAMLQQSGRLPIIPLKKALETADIKLMELSFRWMKKMNISWEEFGIQSSQIPDFLEFKCVVEPDLPQDKLQSAQVGGMISSGDEPLMSQRWTRDNVLNEGQSDIMQSEIWTEKASKMAFVMGMEPMMQQLMAKMMESLYPAQPAPPEQPEGIPTGQPPGRPAGQEELAPGEIPQPAPLVEGTPAPPMQPGQATGDPVIRSGGINNGPDLSRR